MDSKMSESLEEQKLGDTRKGSKGPERYVPGRVGSFDLPFGLGGRWVSQDEYTRITGKSAAPTPSTPSAHSEPAKGGMNAAELKAAQDAANKARQQGRLSDLRGGSEPPKREEPKVEEPKVEQPKVEQPKVEEPKPKLTLDQQYKAARAAKDTAAMEKLGKQIWAKKYSTPEGESKFKAKGVDVSTAKQREMFKDIRAPKPTLKPFERAERIKPKMEAYEVVLDYLLSEGHAETVEEAHYVMMQLDSEYVQSIVESPGEWFRGRLNPDNSVAAQAQRRSPFTQPTKPLPSTPSPFAKPASRDDSGKLTTYGAGGGAAAEARGKTREQVMKQGAENLENKKRTQPVNQGPDFGR